MAKQLVSGLKTPDGTIIYSRHRHDYVTYKDKNGETYMIDGGLDYLRCNVNIEKAEIIELNEDSPHMDLRDHFAWGSYGKGGDEELHYIFLKDMEDSHITALLDYNVKPEVYNLLCDETDYRIDRGITI